MRRQIPFFLWFTLFSHFGDDHGNSARRDKTEAVAGFFSDVSRVAISGDTLDHFRGLGAPGLSQHLFLQSI